MSRASLIVTIDGPSGSGKSTISRLLAYRLKAAYLDTGAMYRAVGLAAQHQGIDLDDQEAVGRLLEALDLALSPGEDDTRVLLNGEDVSLAIRTPEMGMMASRVSAIGAVRQRLTRLQRELAKNQAVVAEGRDTGTVVFPQAAHKFYLVANPEERARRRTAQLVEKGMRADYQEILSQIVERDHQDSARQLAPLQPAPEAVRIDSSALSIGQVVDLMLATINHP